MQTPEPEVGPLSQILQRSLDQGLTLRQHMPPMPRMLSVTYPMTTSADVDGWVRRTKGILASAPQLLARFNSQLPRASGGRLWAANPFELAYKKELDRRIANLGEIVTQLRDQER